MFEELDYKTEQKVMKLFIIIGLIISLIITIILFKNKHINEYEIMTTKTETVDKNSIEFFIGDNSLNKTYNKIKNKKFNEIDLVDKQKINNMLDWYNENWYKYIYIGDTKIKLNKFLNSNDKDIKKYLSNIDDEIKYFTIFYKIIIDNDTSYANYLDKNINEKLIKQAAKNKQIKDTRMNTLGDAIFIIILLTAVIVMIEILALEGILYIDKKL